MLDTTQLANTPLFAVFNNAIGVARSELAPRGTVFVQGETWNAEAAGGVIPAGAPVRVVAVSGLRLDVRAAAPEIRTEGGR